jgi:dynein heavy chain 1
MSKMIHLTHPADHVSRALFRLLSSVQRDLSSLVQVIEGTQKQTNDLRSLISDLTKGAIPSTWSKFKMPRGSSASQFIASLTTRLAQLDKVAKEGVLAPITLSLLFSPTAYLSATQQHAARANNMSLELFRLVLDLGAKRGEGGFELSGKSRPPLAFLTPSS